MPAYTSRRSHRRLPYPNTQALRSITRQYLRACSDAIEKDHIIPRRVPTGEVPPPSLPATTDSSMEVEATPFLLPISYPEDVQAAEMARSRSVAPIMPTFDCIPAPSRSFSDRALRYMPALPLCTHRDVAIAESDTDSNTSMSGLTDYHSFTSAAHSSDAASDDSMSIKIEDSSSFLAASESNDSMIKIEDPLFLLARESPVQHSHAAPGNLISHNANDEPPAVPAPASTTSHPFEPAISNSLPPTNAGSFDDQNISQNTEVPLRAHIEIKVTAHELQAAAHRLSASAPSISQLIALWTGFPGEIQFALST